MQFAIIISLISGLIFYIVCPISQISSRKYPKLKEVDDVLGGAAAWQNVDSTEGIRFSNII